MYIPVSDKMNYLLKNIKYLFFLYTLKKRIFELNTYIKTIIYTIMGERND